MTSNSQLKQKNIELKMQNSNLLDLRFALMSDNRRIEAERDNLRTHNDLLVQALDAVMAERDEARAWARRMMKERDQYRERCVELEARLDIGYGNLADIEPPKFTLEPTGTYIVNRSGTARPDYGHELTGQIGGTGD